MQINGAVGKVSQISFLIWKNKELHEMGFFYNSDELIL